MRIIKEIPINQITVDRYKLGPDTLDLCCFLRQGGSVPPIHVQRKLNGFKICDGRHRITAYKLLGRKKIKARYSEKTIDPVIEAEIGSYLSEWLGKKWLNAYY